MNELFKLVLSLSVSGGLLILLLLACKPLWKKRAGKRWQYYIWLVVVVRLLLPFAPETSLMGAAFRQADAVAVAAGEAPEPAADAPLGTLPQTAAGAGALSAAADEPAERAPLGQGQPAGGISLREALALVRAWAWLVWLLAALALLVRKVVLYRSYVRYIRAGGEAVDDPALLDQLARAGEQVGVRRPVELCVNGLVSSPMVVGVLRPCIVLPTLDLPAQELECTLLHELTHCRRWDALYKWLVQLALCVHWFNPLVYCMEREISRACELSCDEAVIRRMDAQGRRAYGDTLLDAVAIGGGYLRPPAAATLHESKNLLKERLEAISGYQKDHRPAVLGSLAAALALLLCACGVGAYRPFGGTETAPIEAAAAPMPQEETENAPIVPEETETQADAPSAKTVGSNAPDGWEQYTTIENVRSIVVEARYAAVTFQTAETDCISVDYLTPKEEEAYTFSVSEGVLHIVRNNTAAGNASAVRTSLDGTVVSMGSLPLIVTLPDREYESFDVETVNGTVRFDGTVVQSVSAKSTNGTIGFDRTAAQSLSARSANGDVSFTRTVSQRIDAETSNGSIVFDRSLSTVYDCSTANGEIEGTLAGSKADYSISAKTVHGRCNLTDQTVRGTDNSIRFEATNGRIEIEFEA